MEHDLYHSEDLSPAPHFQVRQCSRESCRLRFSIILGDRRGERCPICKAPTIVVQTTASTAADYERYTVDRAIGKPTGPQLEVMLDNIRSAWNVGSMLRTADGAGVRHIHLCGVSSTPDNPKVAKTALGAEKSLPWTFHPDGIMAAQALKEQGLRLWALEGGARAQSLFEVMAAESVDGVPAGAPIVLVAGNELSGVDPDILALSDRVVCLPMHGIKGSLNVAVAFGIAVYTIRFGAYAAVVSTGCLSISQEE